jgi:hypothetical protein
MRVLTAAAAAAALFGGTATAAQRPVSGLHGSVLRGPTTPVCREGVPCHAPAVHLRLSFVRAGVAHVATTDAEGRYAIALAPGTYAVRVARAVGSVRPAAVTVPAGPPRLQDLTVDTGIR